MCSEQAISRRFSRFLASIEVPRRSFINRQEPQPCISRVYVGPLLAILLALVGCDPQTLSCPTPDTCTAVTAPVTAEAPKALATGYPSVTVIHNASLEWHIECGTPAPIAVAMRAAVAWWNLQVQGIFAAESACTSGKGTRFFYAPDDKPGAGVGGPGFVSVTQDGIPPSELASVLRHEIGHAIGLGHVDGPRCLMFWRVDKEDLGTPIELCTYEQQMLIAAYPQGVQ